jgi:hypothetical protein
MSVSISRTCRFVARAFRTGVRLQARFACDSHDAKGVLLQCLAILVAPPSQAVECLRVGRITR